MTVFYNSPVFSNVRRLSLLHLLYGLTHQCRSLPGFCIMRRLRIFLLSSPVESWVESIQLVHRRRIPKIKFACIHGRREALWEWCLVPGQSSNPDGLIRSRVPRPSYRLALWYNVVKTIKHAFSLFYTLIKHGFSTNQTACRDLSILLSLFDRPCTSKGRWASWVHHVIIWQAQRASLLKLQNFTIAIEMSSHTSVNCTFTGKPKIPKYTSLWTEFIYIRINIT